MYGQAIGTGACMDGSIGRRSWGGICTYRSLRVRVTVFGCALVGALNALSPRNIVLHNCRLMPYRGPVLPHVGQLLMHDDDDRGLAGGL